jgi:starch phosphorylase
MALMIGMKRASKVGRAERRFVTLIYMNGPILKPKLVSPQRHAGVLNSTPKTGGNTPANPEANETARLLEQYGCGPVKFSGEPNAAFEQHLLFDHVMALDATGSRERFWAVARSVRDVLSQRWVRTEEAYARANPKRIYYLSMEYLIGRSLANNIMNLRLDPLIGHAVEQENLDWPEMLEQEPDAGLGNGGLGRLAACFLESMATMELPAMGYGLRYEYGMFKQTIQDGWQQEQPDNWLRRPDPWEVIRPREKVEVQLNCSFELHDGRLHVIRGRPSKLIGVPYDRPVIGYGGKTVNTLRLWAAAAPDCFDFKTFSHGDFIGAVAETLRAESLTRVLYPDDSTSHGQGLRFVQEYFLVACSLADLVNRFRQTNPDWSRLPDQVAIQLNDTHPALAVPELMRILLDEAGLGWEEAWDLTRQTLAYTNHTLLPEALEQWPVDWFETFLPRQLEIIYEINRRFLQDVRIRFPGDEGRVARVSLIQEAPHRKVRMANLAIVGTHSTNGVAAIHSHLLRTVTVRDLAEVFPERFNNKTNGVAPRRWLLLANPPLARTISGAIGRGWISDLTQLRKLKPLADDANFQDAVRRAKREAKSRFANWLRATTGQAVDPDTLFDCQVKRIHEYKRQLLNALRVVVLYNRLRENPRLDPPPRTFFFAGKAAPAYHLAKLIIKFINNLAAVIEADAAVRGKIKVVFLPEYCVTQAERLIPASDVSNQISTAGYEASGTSNMKFMMNGALTIGTQDGATIEMAAEAGGENFFLFGLTAGQVANTRGWYNPRWHYDHEPETRLALDQMLTGRFAPEEPGLFAPLFDTLVTYGDHYLHLADLPSYLEADRRMIHLYGDPQAWVRRAILNVAGSGHFSSDRTIAEYAMDIWEAGPCPVS